MASICIVSHVSRDQTQYKIVPDVMVRISEVIKGATLQRVMKATVSIHSTPGPALNLQINLLTSRCSVRPRSIHTEVYDMAETREGNV